MDTNASQVSYCPLIQSRYGFLTARQRTATFSIDRAGGNHVSIDKPILAGRQDPDRRASISVPVDRAYHVLKVHIAMKCVLRNAFDVLNNAVLVAFLWLASSL